MQSHRITKKPIQWLCTVTAFICLFVLLFSVASQAVNETAASKRTPELSSFYDLKGKTVGMLTGAPFEELIREKQPGVKDIQYFSSIADMQLALESKKIDAYLMNNLVADLAVNNNRGLALFPEVLGETTFGIAFPKKNGELGDWQAAFDKLSKQDVEALWNKWTGSDANAKVLPEQTWSGNNGTVHVAACDTLEPASYRGDHAELIGLEEELILTLAEKLDVHVVFDGMEFASVMPAVQSGKDLMGCGSIVVNDERKELVDFLEYHDAQFVLIVRAGTAKASSGFWSGIKDSFSRTFLKDSRYKMVLSGLGLTLLMTICSGALGILLAFLLVLLRQKDKKGWNGFIAFYESLVAGIPAVVILMVLYYIVFGKVHIPAVWVAIIGFAFIFGARGYGAVRSALSAVDAGQREAALALGYTEKETFRKVMLPQARPVYLPLLQAQFVSLMKETSIAGFITVLELTRAGDLIRSRTMEAFFPLISIALIYYVLTWVMTKLVGLIDRHYAKKRDARHVKGVD